MGITHSKVSAIADDAAAAARGEVVPSDWNAAHTITAPLVIDSGTITVSAPVEQLAQTWNAAGVTFTGWKLNVTNTASAAGSLLADFQVGGVSKASINVDGNLLSGEKIYIGGITNSYPALRRSGNGLSCELADFSDLTSITSVGVFCAGGGLQEAKIARGTGVLVGKDLGVFWSSTTSYSGTPDVCLYRDAAATLALRDGTNAQTYRVYGTYTDSSNYVRASLSSSSTVVTLAAETAGTGADDVPIYIRAGGAANIVPYSTLRASGAGVEYQVVDGSNNTTCRYSSTYLESGSGHFIRWRDNVDARNGSSDAGLARNGAGIVEVNSGTAGTFRDLKLRNLLAGGGNGSYVQTPSMTVANLAAAGTAGAGARAFVTDATATTFLSTVAGGGANKVPVVSDGTNWLIG